MQIALEVTTRAQVAVDVDVCVPQGQVLAEVRRASKALEVSRGGGEWVGPGLYPPQGRHLIHRGAVGAGVMYREPHRKRKGRAVVVGHLGVPGVQSQTPTGITAD